MCKIIHRRLVGKRLLRWFRVHLCILLALRVRNNSFQYSEGNATQNTKIAFVSDVIRNHLRIFGDDKRGKVQQTVRSKIQVDHTSLLARGTGLYSLK